MKRKLKIPINCLSEPAPPNNQRTNAKRSRRSRDISEKNPALYSLHLFHPYRLRDLPSRPRTRLTCTPPPLPGANRRIGLRELIHGKPDLFKVTLRRPSSCARVRLFIALIFTWNIILIIVVGDIAM